MITYLSCPLASDYTFYQLGTELGYDLIDKDMMEFGEVAVQNVDEYIEEVSSFLKLTKVDFKSKAINFNRKMNTVYQNLDMKKGKEEYALKQQVKMDELLMAFSNDWNTVKVQLDKIKEFLAGKEINIVDYLEEVLDFQRNAAALLVMWMSLGMESRCHNKFVNEYKKCDDILKEFSPRSHEIIDALKQIERLYSFITSKHPELYLENEEVDINGKRLTYNGNVKERLSKEYASLAEQIEFFIIECNRNNYETQSVLFEGEAFTVATTLAPYDRFFSGIIGNLRSKSNSLDYSDINDIPFLYPRTEIYGVVEEIISSVNKKDKGNC